MVGGGELGRVLMVLGALVFVVGFALASGWRPPLGRLPGDIVIRHDGATFYFPLATCLLLSVLFSLLAWVLRR